jgi:hypothetical protein
MFASAAILRGIGRVDSHIGPTSFFRFARQLTEKCRPGCIMNTFCQTMGVRHPVHMEVFHTDDTKPINNVTAILVGEVLPFERNALMHTSDNFTMFLVLRPFADL